MYDLLKKRKKKKKTGISIERCDGKFQAPKGSLGTSGTFNIGVNKRKVGRGPCLWWHLTQVGKRQQVL